MWRPGFPYAEALPARLSGAHRALCVYSWVHRGTREQPGLVLGLDRGGSCRGLAYRVLPQNREEVIGYLRDRELVTNVYREAWRPIRLEGQGSVNRPHRALTFLVDPTHEQYAGKLDPEKLLVMTSNAKGQSGINRDYIIATARHIRQLGFADPVLDWLAERLNSSL